ncbi:hypothetical protein ACHOLT_00505 [Desulfitobacterium sp. Sab5]|uniref:hypothetical protein n=1 Tax=Desulfitobacterium nosdiversum TaxID=3375356 RepID=UPI003CE78D38
MKKNLIKIMALATLGSLILIGCGTAQQASAPAAPAAAGTDDLKKQVEDIKGALPKFAIPMREVGDRFDDMYFAAKGGNWALASYMSKYMDKAMTPAKITKPAEYPAWTSFYTGTFDPVNKAIAAKDFAAFDKAYTSAIESCNGCHSSMGYKFVKIPKPQAPVDTHLDYSLKSEPGDVPK